MHPLCICEDFAKFPQEILRELPYIGARSSIIPRNTRWGTDTQASNRARISAEGRGTRNMVKLFMGLVILILLTAVGLLGYGYSGLMQPETVELRDTISIPLE